MSSRALAGVAGALLVVVSVWAFLRTGERAAPAAAAQDQTALIEELRDLRLAQERTVAALERVATELAARPAAARVAERRDADGAASADELVAAIDALRRALEEHGARVVHAGGADAEPLDDVADRAESAGWSAWAPLIELYEQDQAEARRRLQLRGVREVLREFGRPAYTGTDEGSMFLHYTEPLAAGADRRPDQIRVKLLDGVVVDLRVDRGN